ncbi:MAG: lycopene cyclase domain-containing protein [Chloroflexota bacterium]|nr:lycopene cyclase domain-containing protein [Chloroflexota bacterium]
MSYWQFLAFFLVLPLSGLLWWARHWLNRRFLIHLVYLVVISLIFTIPMDNFAISQGIWSFNLERTWRVTMFRIPVEEYFFYVLWIAMSSLLTLICWHGFGLSYTEGQSEDAK